MAPCPRVDRFESPVMAPQIVTFSPIANLRFGLLLPRWIIKPMASATYIRTPIGSGVAPSNSAGVVFIALQRAQRHLLRKKPKKMLTDFSQASRRKSRANGFSTVELLVAMGIITLMTAVALPSFVRSYRRYQLSDAAYKVAGVLKFAHYEAVRLN